MATVLWDAAGFETSPAGSDVRSITDDRIRELKLAIRQRLEQGGHFVLDPTPPYSLDGRHGRFGSTPFALYASNGTTKMLDLPDDTHLDVISGTTLRAATGADTDFSNTPFSQGEILNNSCSKITASQGVIYAGALGTDFALITLNGVLTGSPPGAGIVIANFAVRGASSDNTFSHKLQIDRANNGTWVTIGPVTIPTTIALTAGAVPTTNLRYDDNYATNGSTVNYRLLASHVAGGSDNYVFSDIKLIVAEFRR